MPQIGIQSNAWVKVATVKASNSPGWPRCVRRNYLCEWPIWKNQSDLPLSEIRLPNSVSHFDFPISVNRLVYRYRCEWPISVIYVDFPISVNLPIYWYRKVRIISINHFPISVNHFELPISVYHFSISENKFLPISVNRNGLPISVVIFRYR